MTPLSIERIHGIMKVAQIATTWAMSISKIPMSISRRAGQTRLDCCTFAEMGV